MLMFALTLDRQYPLCVKLKLIVPTVINSNPTLLLHLPCMHSALQCGLSRRRKDTVLQLTCEKGEKEEEQGKNG